MAAIREYKIKLAKYTEVHSAHREPLILSRMKNYKSDGFYREGDFSNEIIWNGKSFRFPQGEKGNAFRRALFLFGLVKKDVLTYLEKHGKIDLPTKYPVNVYNEKYKYFKMPITGTDLNHAYWKIALFEGFISQKTYDKGLSKDAYKPMRLAALSALGAHKEYQVIKNGVLTEETIRVLGNEDLQDVYKFIRYKCYIHMQKLKRLLKDQFVAYRTDCIYYKKTVKNVALVEEYLASTGIEFKQLGKIPKKKIR